MTFMYTFAALTLRIPYGYRAAGHLPIFSMWHDHCDKIRDRFGLIFFGFSVKR